MPLSNIQKAALVALADACRWSLTAHVPMEAVTRKVASHLRGDVRKAIHDLKRMGYCIPHPTRGGTTWQLTRAGLEVAQAISQSAS